MDLQGFLQRNHISQEKWEASQCNWEALQEIAEDHEHHSEQLKESAEFFAKVVQKIPKVHSVRWRVKDTEHLLEKIVRKRADGNEKYLQITRENYFDVITDLVGLRALHLFKDDCVDIHGALKEKWRPVEAPIAYIRQGDEATFAAQLGLKVEAHPAGYRSLHYVLESKPLQRAIKLELQVRTIFEEGWSEIDHKVRYPYFLDNELVSYFLTIFNRLAGSADEMGSFVKGLAQQLNSLDSDLRTANREKDQILAAMDDTVATLETLKKQDVDSQVAINKLKQELSQLKESRSASTANPDFVELLNTFMLLAKKTPSKTTSATAEPRVSHLNGEKRQNDSFKERK